MKILKPDGNELSSQYLSTGPNDIDAPALPTSGTYTVVIDANNNTGAVTITLSEAQSGTLAIDGPAVSATIGRPGQDIRYTFSGTAGQYVSVALTGVTIPGDCCDSDRKFNILKPDGGTLGSEYLSTKPPAISSPALPSTGTYTLLVDANVNTGSLILTLAQGNVAPFPSASVAIDESPTVSSTTVHLKLSASGTNGSQVTGMHIWGDGTDTGWVPFVPTYTWTLSGGDGPKTAFVQFRDAASALSAPSSSSTTLSLPWPSYGLDDKKLVANSPVDLECAYKSGFDPGEHLQEVLWGSGIKCTVGTPSSVQLTLYKAWVHAPDTFFEVDQYTYQCFRLPTGYWASCTAPQHQRSVPKTEILKVHAQWLVIGDSGRAYDIEQDYVWQVNDKGVLYPRISPSGPGWSGPNWDYVPFPGMRPVKDGVPVLTVEPPPGPYYDRCDDGQLLVIVGACPEQDAFSNDYRESAKAYYAYKGWELPLVEYQVHHLKPRSHGGNNSNQNLVALTTEQHTPFTTWWLSFSWEP